MLHLGSCWDVVTCIKGRELRTESLVAIVDLGSKKGRGWLCVRVTGRGSVDHNYDGNKHLYRVSFYERS